MTPNKNYRGAVLVYALMIVTFAMIVLVGMLRFTLAQIHASQYAVPHAQALHIAEAGVYYYRWYLAHSLEGLSTVQANLFWENEAIGVDDNGDGDCDDPDSNDPDGDGKESHTVAYEGLGTYSLCVTRPEQTSTIITMRSTGTVVQGDHMQTRTIQTRLRKKSWSEFAVLGNAAARLFKKTQIFGPMHFNGGIRFDGVAHNIVSSAVATYKDPDRPGTVMRPGVWTGQSNEYNTIFSSPVFRAGKNFPQPTEDFNAVATDFAAMKERAQETGHYYDNSGQGRHIVLYNNGTYAIRLVKSYYKHQRGGVQKQLNGDNEIQSTGAFETKDIPQNGVIFVEDNVWIEGEVDDTVLTITAATVGSGPDPKIFITKNLRYSERDGTSVLGLAAEGDIEFTRDANNYLIVDAALMSQYGRVGRNHYGWRLGRYFCNGSIRNDGTCQGSWIFDKRQKTELYGSIASNGRIGFGFTDGTGFQERDLIFDSHLNDTPPPFFPTGARYHIDQWIEIE